MDDYQFIELATKPGAKLSYRFLPSPIPPPKPTLVVFVNGLGLPQAGWTPTIQHLQQLRKDTATLPHMLTYDRYGQGQTTDRDPQDAHAADPSHGHDCLSAVRDLRQLLVQVADTHLGIKTPADMDATLRLVLVSNSIGGALSRLYAQHFPRTVDGLLLLDSVLANSDFVSIFPDPDGPSFDAATLPEGVTPDTLRASRASVLRTFHPRNGSREGLSRLSLASLLPLADGPVLEGRGSEGGDGKGPWVTVVGHDFEAFARESEAMMGQPAVMTMTYTNPYWERYNEGLVKIAGSGGRGKGPVRAEGAGHFVQKDNPAFVAAELDEMLGKIV